MKQLFSSYDNNTDYCSLEPMALQMNLYSIEYSYASENKVKNK